MKLRFHPGMMSFLGALAIRLLGLTWRVEWSGEENLQKARQLSDQVIFAFFHGRLLALSWSHRNRNIHVLASEHRDGDLMGRTIEWLGFGHLKGSTSRGGSRALRELRGVLADGFDIGLTVDGPRGPRGKVQQGATELSRLAGSAVVPVSNSAARRRLLRSWDRFQIPMPFSRIVVEYGDPFIVPADCGAEEREGFRKILEENLRILTEKLDRELGYSGDKVWPHEGN
jgi:lysophospholipid acyltransferase (LPLAT)-like uncharacterized protein